MPPLSAGHKRPKHSKACTSARTIGSINHQDKMGPNSVSFTGRLGGPALPPGSYLLEATPSVGALSGSTIAAHFRVR